MNLIPLEPIKAIYSDLNWRDDIGNGMAIGDSAETNITVAPDRTVRVLFGNLEEPVFKLLAHLTGNATASREYLAKAVAEADEWPLRPYYDHIGGIGARVVRRVGVDAQFHELYVVFPTPAAAVAPGQEC
jgi:hypothetical protein